MISSISGTSPLAVPFSVISSDIVNSKNTWNWSKVKKLHNFTQPTPHHNNERLPHFTSVSSFSQFMFHSWNETQLLAWFFFAEAIFSSSLDFFLNYWLTWGNNILLSLSSARKVNIFLCIITSASCTTCMSRHIKQSIKTNNDLRSKKSSYLILLFTFILNIFVASFACY